MATSIDSSPAATEIAQSNHKAGKLHPALRRTVAGLFGEADVLINGSRPSDIIVHDERFYQRVLADGSLGLGESYMDHWWDCQEVDELIARLLGASLDEKIQPRKFFYLFLLAHLMNPQRKSKAYQVGE